MTPNFFLPDMSFVQQHELYSFFHTNGGGGEEENGSNTSMISNDVTMMGTQENKERQNFSTAHQQCRQAEPCMLFCQQREQAQDVAFDDDDVLVSKHFFPIVDVDHLDTIDTMEGQQKQGVLKLASSARARTQSYHQDNEDELIPTPYDVISGRSSSSFNNIGNGQFRRHIKNNLPLYIKAKARHAKTTVIISTIKTFQYETGARFFKKKGGKFVELEEKELRSKVGHALRDTAVQKAASGPSPPDLGKGKCTIGNVKAAIESITSSSEKSIRMGLCGRPAVDSSSKREKTENNATGVLTRDGAAQMTFPLPL